MRNGSRGAQTVYRLVVLTGICSLPAMACWADLWGLSVDPYGTAAPGTENNYNKVFRFDNEGNKLPNDIPTSAGAIYPTGIAVSPSGNIYVSSQATGSILYFDGETGSPLTPLEGSSPGLFTYLPNDPLAGDPDPAASPAQMAFGPDGNLYVSEFFGDRVRVYDPVTGQRLADAATGLTSAGGLTFASNGDLFIGDGFIMGPGQSARIARVHNGVASTYGISDMGMLSSPAALEFLSNGDLLVADLLGNYVARFDATGFGFTPFTVIPPAIPDPLPPGVFVPSNNPSDIDFDPDGNILVSVLGLTNPPDDRGALLRYDLDGNLIETIVDGLEPMGGMAWTADPDTLVGDYDGNQSIGPSDFAKWAADFGKHVAAGNGADGNADGVVDASDYVIWRKASAGGGSSGAMNGVPEPTGSAILLSGILALMVGRRSGRGSRPGAN